VTRLWAGFVLALLESDADDGARLGRILLVTMGAALAGGALGRSAHVSGLEPFGYSVLGVVCALSLAQLTLLFYGPRVPHGDAKRRRCACRR
jgi:hypothetical protein